MATLTCDLHRGQSGGLLQKLGCKNFLLGWSVLKLLINDGKFHGLHSP